MAEIIFGIDHGNGNMKGETSSFPCGIVRYTAQPGRFMNEDILEYEGAYYTLSETKMPFKADKTVDDDYFILTLFTLVQEARKKNINLTGKDVVLGVGLPPADFGQQAVGFKQYFIDHSRHGISFRMNDKPVSFYLKDVFVSPQNFAAVMCFKASLLKKYRTVNCIDIGDGTVDLLVIRNGKPDLSVRVSERSGMAVLRSEISNRIQQNYGIHLDSSDVEQVLMGEETILEEEIIKEIYRMADDWVHMIINKLHAHVTDFRTNPAIFLGGGSLLLKKVFDESKPFDYPKSLELIKRSLKLGTNEMEDDIILDFFSGSATTAHAVMQLNAEDGGNRKYIMVQLPEVCDEKSEAYKARYKNICEIGKERIRRAGEKVKSDETLPAENREKLDIGFKVFKLDSSNIKEWDSETEDLR